VWHFNPLGNYQYFEDLKRYPIAKIGQKDNLETAPKMHPQLSSLKGKISLTMEV
jgi:hypothetical protein